MKKNYDFVIIGFGPAASTLAYMLGRDTTTSVLLLELGTNELENKIVLDPYGVFAVQNFPNICTTTVTDTDFSPQSYGTRLQLYNGTTWGGGSSVNYQVYDRGSRFNWDRLRDFNPLFDYDLILKEFWLRVENYSCSPIKVNDKSHGLNGNF
jgi:choline dehydrogenase-like flavoprotein